MTDKMIEKAKEEARALSQAIGVLRFALEKKDSGELTEESFWSMTRGAIKLLVKLLPSQELLRIFPQTDFTALADHRSEAVIISPEKE